MKLESEFAVAAPPEVVFATFLDADVVRLCLPGCQELERVDENRFVGKLMNQIAHVRFQISFSADIVEMNPPHEVHAVLRGDDSRLASSLNVTATLKIDPEGDGSIARWAVDVVIWGKLGRMGESIIRRRTAEVEKQFIEEFTAHCEGRRESEAALEAEPQAAAPAPAATQTAAATSTLAAAPAQQVPPVRSTHPTTRGTGWRKRLSAVRTRLSRVVRKVLRSSRG